MWALPRRSLKGKVDLLYTSFDNGVVSAYEAVYKAGTEIELPSGGRRHRHSEARRHRGLRPGFLRFGRANRPHGGAHLKGEQPGSITPEHPKEGSLVVNPAAAARWASPFPKRC